MDVFERQGAKSSSRPRLVMCGEVLGWDQSVVLTQYGEGLRTSRRLFHQYIGSRGQFETTLKKVGALEEMETHASCKRILQDPDPAKLAANIRRSVYFAVLLLRHNVNIPFFCRTAGSVIVKVAYGYQVKEGKDEFLERVEAAMDGFTATGVLGTYLVDIIPACTFTSFLCSAFNLTDRLLHSAICPIVAAGC